MSKYFRCSIALLLPLTFNTGCGDDASQDQICGGHGEMHDNHCHCDAGFVLSDDGSSCEPGQDSEQIDYGGDFVFEPSQILALTGTDGGSQFWLLEAMEDDVQLKIEIYEAYGGLSSPGSITIDDVEANYATCGTCILLETGCAAHGDHYHCERTFMPMVGGEFQLDDIGDSAGDQFTGQLLGVVFQEVTIGSDYQTQQVAEGEQIHLIPWGFDTLLEDFSSAETR